MLQSFLGVLWLFTRSAISSQTKEFVGILTGYDNLTVWADGNLLCGNGDYWYSARWLSFSSKTKIIAVSVINIPGGTSGFLGIFSNGVVTDASWKCKETLTPENGWEQINFNDNAWPNAYMRDDNSGTNVYGIPSNVHWISPANHLADKFICRRRFSTEERRSNNTLISMVGSMATNNISLYLDGVFTANAVDSLIITFIKDQHKLQAVQVEDNSVSYVLLLASSSNGVRTNNLWKCSNVYYEGWFLPEYDDSFWPRAYASDSIPYYHFIAPDAKWIGYLNSMTTINKIYCRQNTNTDPAFLVTDGTTSARDLETPVTTSVPQMTNFPTNSIDSTTKVMKPSPATTLTSRTVSTAASSPPRAPSTTQPSSTNTRRVSMVVIVVIVVGVVTAVIIGLGASCFIWRKLRNRRKNDTKELQKTNDKWEMKSDCVTVYEELGHGAFGKVFKGILKTSSCITRGSTLTVQQTSKKKVKSSMAVAVKMLQENATPDQKNDFLDEINLMKAVGLHKNIVSLIGCCTKSSPNFLLVEFASQGDLLSYLREMRKKVKDFKATYVRVRGSPSISGRSNQERLDGHEVDTEIGQVNVAFSKADNSIKIKTKSMPYLNDEEQDQDEEDSFLSKDMMSFSWQIAQGMEYLSGKGIVHRDLAARNVLVYDDNLVKVADFGLARNTLQENVYRMTGQHNKLPIKWMSPEAINDGVFTTKSDVWSYGIVLWEVTTLGGFPYPGIKNSELMRLLKRGYRMEKPDTCSEEFYQLITRCWEENPDVRPTFTELCQDLEDWMQQDTPYLDMDQVDEDQPYYDASAVPASSESSCAELARETPKLNCKL